MKLRKDKDILSFIGIGLIAILLGSIVLFFQIDSKAIMVLGGILILAGIMTCIMGLVASTKPKTELIQDERVTRINEKAGCHAGWMIMLSVIILFHANRIWSLGVELEDMYYMVLFVGMISWSLLRWIYNKKGDVK
ncbi:MAG: DUF2178 domain-containing protein [Candidatus Aenigmarchaeota archaeon]|nr:DUF2178 domain-containing protein [Candidatus Aenigmarchaeota archaeon]